MFPQRVLVKTHGTTISTRLMVGLRWASWRVTQQLVPVMGYDSLHSARQCGAGGEVGPRLRMPVMAVLSIFAGIGRCCLPTNVLPRTPLPTSTGNDDFSRPN
jgi:hypothetical protein